MKTETGNTIKEPQVTDTVGVLFGVFCEQYNSLMKFVEQLPLFPEFRPIVVQDFFHGYCIAKEGVNAYLSAYAAKNIVPIKDSTLTDDKLTDTTTETE